MRLEDRHGKRVPMAVKIAPDVADSSIPQIADQLVEHRMDAVIATNTTTERSNVSGVKHADEAGGLSGRPLTERATQVVHLLASHLQGTLPIIGVGGIMQRIATRSKRCRRAHRWCSFTRASFIRGRTWWRNALKQFVAANALFHRRLARRADASSAVVSLG